MNWSIIALCSFCLLMLASCNSPTICVDREVQCDASTAQILQCGDLTKVIPTDPGADLLFYRGCFPAHLSESFTCLTGNPDDITDECADAIHTPCTLIKSCADEYVRCSDPRPEICTLEYVPVCARYDTGIRCVTFPCDGATDEKTYSSGCSACSDKKVLGYSPGRC